MKLSFSFTKVAPPKKVLQVQLPSETDAEKRREVMAISAESGVVIQKTEEDIEAERIKTMVIPCKTLYTKPESTIDTRPNTSVDEAIPSISLTTVGLVKNPNFVDPASSGEAPAKKVKQSILMQIMEAKKRGEVQDAPTQDVRSLDASEFGWALLRGMGYDESKETAETVNDSVIGNRMKLGIGVKSIPLPSDKK